MNQIESDGKKVTLASIGKVHGIKGWVRLNSYTEPPENLLQYQDFYVRGGTTIKRLKLDDSRYQADKLIGHFQGYDNPETARELTGLDLQIDADQLPVLEQGDYYWHQLQGLTVTNLQGDNLGIVKQLMATGANDVLVVSPTGQSLDSRERLIPWLEGTVIRQVDLEAGAMTVDWPADYLS